MNNDKKQICKLFYRMDMFYLIINRKTTFYLKRWALGGASIYIYMGVSKNNDTPKSSILIGFSIINHPFWGPTPIFGNTHIACCC